MDFVYSWLTVIANCAVALLVAALVLIIAPLILISAIAIANFGVGVEGLLILSGGAGSITALLGGAAILFGDIADATWALNKKANGNQEDAVEAEEEKADNQKGSALEVNAATLKTNIIVAYHKLNVWASSTYNMLTKGPDLEMKKTQ